MVEQNRRSVYVVCAAYKGGQLRYSHFHGWKVVICPSSESQAWRRESLRLAQLQLEEDLIRTTDLLQIQDELVRAQTDHVNALYDHAIARITLMVARERDTAIGMVPIQVPHDPIRQADEECFLAVALGRQFLVIEEADRFRP